MSGWSGFFTAVSGLYSSQKSLYTASHNIANVNTEGYSRQQVLSRTNSAFMLPGVGMLGMGNAVYDISRVRDSYLDFKVTNENAPLGEWEVKSQSLMEIESMFNEPSDSSFRRHMDDFFVSLEKLSINPSNSSNRSLVRQMAVALTKHLNETAQNLYDTQKNLNFAVRSKVKQINDYAEQISGLNNEIYKIEVDGKNANDLRDRRDLLVGKLSKIVNIQTDEREGKFRVTIGGITLVNHVETSKLNIITADNKYNPDERLAQVEWETGNQPLKLESGELKGLLEVRDGDGTGSSYRGVAFYIERLDEFARKLVEKFNAVHYNGTGLNNSSNMLFFSFDQKNTADFDSELNTATGTVLSAVDFTNTASGTYNDYKDFIADNVRADNISLSGDILSSLDNIAHIAAASGDNGVENNENVLKLIELRHDNFFFDDTTPQGTPDDFLKAILSNVAVDSQQAGRMSKNQNVIMSNIKRNQESISGVSLDEEMSNIVRFQHCYNASARIISTIDAIYDITINRLGLVGR